MSHWEKNGQSDEWYTPRYVFDALGCEFDLDVAAPEQGPMHCPAKRWLSQGSLKQEWKGFVWMNPPYGGRNSLDPWLAKFFDHGDGLALVPDRTSAPWFQNHWPKVDLAIFTPKIRFLKPDGSEGKSPSNGSAILGAGTLACRALRNAANAGLGILAQPGSITL